MSYEWIDIGNGRSVYRRVDSSPPPQRSSLACPMVITDSMDPVEHPCDGNLYTSKSRFREITKANDCIEIGNDPGRFKTPVPAPPDLKSIDTAIEKAVARVSAGDIAHR